MPGVLDTTRNFSLYSVRIPSLTLSMTISHICTDPGSMALGFRPSYVRYLLV